MVHSKKNSGFTLVELSIVLIVIALVVAGILSSQTLIQNAKLLSVYDDINKFSTAFSSFRDSYKATPGDLGNLPGASFNNVGTARNNGMIDWNIVLNDGTNQTTESTLFWQHLFIAGLNNFNPKFSSTYTEEVGKDYAPSKITGAGYQPYSWNNFGYAHAITFRTTNDVANPSLSASEAFFLDSKYDDGKPLTGSIQFNLYWATLAPYADCLVAGNQDYKVDVATADKKSCNLFFTLPK